MHAYCTWQNTGDTNIPVSSGLGYLSSNLKWLVRFYGISIFSSYLIANPVYTYIYYIYIICK